MKPGDLVKYMSRIVLIVGTCPNNDAAGNKWVFGIELEDGEIEVGKYRKSVLKVINEAR